VIDELAETTRTIDLFQGKQIGTVVDNNDPEKLGRVKVQVNVFKDTATADIPWALVLHPVGLGGSSAVSVSVIPEVGTEVVVEFLDRYTPMVVGKLTSAITHQTSHDTNYPERYGFADPKGLTTVIDKTAGTVSVAHVSGTTFTIDSAGNVAITATGTMNLTSGGNMTLVAPRIDLNP